MRPARAGLALTAPVRRAGRVLSVLAVVAAVAVGGVAVAPAVSATNLAVPSHYCTAPSATSMALTVGDTLSLTALGACNQLTWPEKTLTASVNGAAVTGGTASNLTGAAIVLTATTAGADVVRLSNNGADAMTITVIVVGAPSGGAARDAASTSYSVTRDNSGVMCSQGTGVSGFLLANCLTVVIDMVNDGDDDAAAGAADRASARKKRKVMTVRIDANAMVINDWHIDPQASQSLQQSTVNGVTAAVAKLIDSMAKANRSAGSTSSSNAS